MKNNSLNKYYNVLFGGSKAFLLLFFFPIIFFGCSTEEIDFQQPAMWGNLEKGNYDIGFKTIFYYDIAKNAVPYSDWDGNLYPVTKNKGRQMQLNVWYPAKINNKDQNILFGHYVDLLSLQTDFSKINKSKREFAIQEFINKTNTLGSNNVLNKENLDSLMKMNTAAYLNPKAVADKFPLIVFPNGGSPAFQSIMCEYFASHGFIVAAMALKGQHSFTGEASVRGIESAVDDLDFALRKLLEIPQVNQLKIGMIGNAITSSQIAAYKSRNDKIECIISLEGGLLSSFEQNLLKKTPFYEDTALDVPILAIYAPHPAISPYHIFHLRYAERYFVHFPEMSEFHFLNYGMFEQFIPNIIGKPRGNVQKGYEWGAVYSLKFFEAKLKGNTTSQKFLDDGPPTNALDFIDTLFIKQALAAPPKIAFIKDGFLRKGFQFVDSIYNAQKNFTDKPFSRVFYNDMRDWLAWKKDPNYEYRFRLYQLASESFPESSEVCYYFASYANKSKKKKLALKNYKKALQLLKTDSDANLKADKRERIKSDIMKKLKELKK